MKQHLEGALGNARMDPPFEIMHKSIVDIGAMVDDTMRDIIALNDYLFGPSPEQDSQTPATRANAGAVASVQDHLLLLENRANILRNATSNLLTLIK